MERGSEVDFQKSFAPKRHLNCPEWIWMTHQRSRFMPVAEYLKEKKPGK
jgi:hypothetical protein